MKGAGCSKRERRYSSGLWPSSSCNAQDLSSSILIDSIVLRWRGFKAGIYDK
jgi:hypothetical protein